jgi:UDP-glucose 4-epimerase
MPERRWRGHASAYMGESVIDLGKCYRNNAVGSLTLLDAARAAGVNRT